MGPFGSTQGYQSADSGGCRFRRAANPLRLALQDSSKVPIQAGADSDGQEGFRVALSKVQIQAVLPIQAVGGGLPYKTSRL